MDEEDVLQDLTKATEASVFSDVEWYNPQCECFNCKYGMSFNFKPV